METEHQTVYNQPELSMIDGSGEDAVRFFNETAVGDSTLLRSVLLRNEVVSDYEPVSTDELSERQQGVAIKLRELLQVAHNGRILDFDGDTWAAILQNDTYQAEAHTLRNMHSGNEKLETQRRRVAATGLGIYAGRLTAYLEQTSTVVQLRPATPAVQHVEPGVA